MTKKMAQNIASPLDYKKTPLWIETLSLEERLNYLVNELTIEEKIQCLTVKAPEIERLGLASFTIGGEAAHGVEARHDQEINKGKPVNTTVFTQPIGMSATWDTALIEKAGVVVGTEARAIYKEEGNIGLSRWAPTIDMERDPRWGRTEEGYGEDPYLVGKMSSAYIQGLQGRDDFYIRCAATLKHFYANNEEKDRTYSSSSIDSRNKHEYYLEPFRRAIIDGRAEAVMTSYNEINGIPAIVNNEVQEIVKDRWELKGHVVCDMGDFGHTVTEHKYFETDAETIAYALKAGIDVFNDPEVNVIEAAKEALRKGLITEEDLNRSIRHTFTTKLRLGIYDAGNKCPYSDIDANHLNCEEHKEICLKVAKKAMVLLKNEKQLLPLESTTKESIAVVGPLADVWYKDWYSGLPQSEVTPYEGIRREFLNADLSLVDGIDRIRIRVGERYLAVKRDGTCYLSGEQSAEIFEHMDWGDNKHTLCASSNKKILTADMDTGSIIANQDEVFSWFVQEAFSFHEIVREKESKEIGITKFFFTLESWNHMPVYVNEEGRLLFGEQKGGTVFTLELVIDGIKQAVEFAKSADKVIAVLGCHPIISSKEDVDRIDLSLPPVQRKLLQNMMLVNPNVILVLITNYPYAIDWEEENLPAILMTSSGSQELGTAIAGAIAGDYSPAGRLNMTWYLSSKQLPSMREYDIIHSKRTYQYFDGKVIYPFGYGLTYTEFVYHDLKVIQDTYQLKIKLIVKNVGAYDSDEVVQLYVSQLYSRTTRPIKQLKGFQRVFIRSGEEIQIQFNLSYTELNYYDVVSGRMAFEDSDYEVQVGTSSRDIRLETKIHVDGAFIHDNMICSQNVQAVGSSRDMTKTIPCDHYDSYENIYLHLGHAGKPCMLPKTMVTENHLPVSGIAIYNDVRFDFIPKLFVIDVKAEEYGTIKVWFGKTELAKISIDTMVEFKTIEVPISTTKFVVGEKKSLQLEIQGKLRVVEFSFMK